ncbi:MAG: CoB--CoM heterodisulfide reductase iron-sulfur subunit A family protein [bacterium JZ-2024 1]
MARIGVFLYYSEQEIANILRLDEIETVLMKEIPEVVAVLKNPALLTEEGLRFVKESIAQYHLDRVVIGAGAPEKYLPTFRKAATEAKLNPYLVTIVNIREGVAWPHAENPEVATRIALEQLTMAIKRILYAEPLETRRIKGEQRVLIIGGGSAGIRAAVAASGAGFSVILVERRPTLGGTTTLLSKLYPRMEDAESYLIPTIMELVQRENVRVLSYAEVVSITGYLGNFDVVIRQRARKVKPMTSEQLAKAEAACPVSVPNEYNGGLTQRKAIFMPFDTAVPRIPLIDRASCLRFRDPPEDCRLCQQATTPDVIDYNEEDLTITERVGGIIVATGAEAFDPKPYTQLRFGFDLDVVSAMQMEHLLRESLQKSQPLVRRSNKQPVTSVTLICEVGSEETTKGIPYSSELPGMIAAKQAITLKEIDPTMEVTVLYPEKRTHTKGYLEFHQRAEFQYGVRYIRGKPSEVVRHGGTLKVIALNTILNETVEIPSDLVVLVTDLVPSQGTRDIAEVIGLRRDERGFIEEDHPAFAPLSAGIEGVWVVGSALGPADVRETNLQSDAAVGTLVTSLPTTGKETDPYLAVIVNEQNCTGCFDCGRICPYHAFELIPSPYAEHRRIVRVLTEYCTGCGLCVPVCTPRVLELQGQTKRQLESEVKIAWAKA